MGYGDYLMLSGMARDLRKKLRVAVTAKTLEHTEFFRAVFRGNPHVTRAAEVAPGTPCIDLPKLELGRRDPAGGRIEWRDDFTPQRGDLYLEPEERAFAVRAMEAVRREAGERPLVFLNPYAKQGAVLNATAVSYEHHFNKEWGAARYAALVGRLRDRVAFVQTFAPEDARPPVPGALLAPGSSFRQAAALLDECDAYLGCEGGMHHVAAALGKRAVVIFGGWISPRTSGYAFHDNVYRGEPGGACGALAPCEHCTRIMADISVEEIAMRMAAALAR
jgi:hypothetical protein